MMLSFPLQQQYIIKYMKMAFGLCAIVLVSSWASMAYASDPGQLQDFCVAVPDSSSAGNSIDYIKPTLCIGPVCYGK